LASQASWNDAPSPSNEKGRSATATWIEGSSARVSRLLEFSVYLIDKLDRLSTVSIHRNNGHESLGNHPGKGEPLTDLFELHGISKVGGNPDRDKFCEQFAQSSLLHNT
jgi:hypothetical protein